jgi:hypothetical protein
MSELTHRPSNSVELVAYTRPETFVTSDIYPNSSCLDFDRVCALSYSFNGIVDRMGVDNRSGMGDRRLIVSRITGVNIMNAYKRITDGQDMNCHGFSNIVHRLYQDFDPPTRFVNSLKPVNNLPIGSLGLIGCGNYICHSIGYGLDNEGLQVLSAQKEMGFAVNSDVVRFYQEVFPEDKVALYQMPLTR